MKQKQKKGWNAKAINGLKVSVVLSKKVQNFG